MEYIKENINKLGFIKEVDKLKIKMEKYIKILIKYIRKNKFITSIGILFILFSTINIMLITYFMQVIKIL